MEKINLQLKLGFSWLPLLPQRPSLTWGQRESRAPPLACRHTHQHPPLSALHPSHAQAQGGGCSLGQGNPLWVGSLLSSTLHLAASSSLQILSLPPQLARPSQE